MSSRLQCITHINYRKGATQGRRLGQSVVTITPNLKNKQEYNLVITTRQNAAGTTYKNLHKNVIKLFTACASQGKMTISMREPEHDILIMNAHNQQLQKFISILKAVMTGEPLPKMSCSQPPTKVEPEITKMHIRNRSEFPMRGFPSSLRTLWAVGIHLTRLPKSIINLQHLVDLDLTGNSLTKIPPELTSMNLISLNLSYNQLTEVGDIFRGALGRSLITFTLSNNRISRLAYSFGITKLRFIDLSGNQLTTLPPGFEGGDQLQTISLDNNPLTYLPAVFKPRFSKLSLPHFLEPVPQILTWRTEPLKLRELAARIMRGLFRQDEIYGSELPIEIKAYICSMVPCGLCGKPCFPSPKRRSFIKEANLNLAREIVAQDEESRLAHYRCSLKCSSSV